MENSPERPLPTGPFAHGPARIDGGLFIGPFFAVLGLLTGAFWMSAVGAAFWVLSYVYCAPWRGHLIRVWPPPRDHALATAVLAWGSAPWALFIAYGEVLAQPATLRWAAPAIMAPGAAAILSTYLPWWRPRQPTALRALVLVSGGMIFLGWIAAYGWLVRQAFWPVASPALGTDQGQLAMASFLLLPMPFFGLWMAVRLLVAPLENPSAA